MLSPFDESRHLDYMARIYEDGYVVKLGDAHYEEFMRTSPMHRNGDPELDIGSVAHFLCTDACRYLTGQTFMCDGGTYLWA